MHSNSINAVAVASKIQSLSRPIGSFLAHIVREKPRVIEAMAFIQWHSWQPGGLDALVNDLVENSAPWIGTDEMVKAGIPQNEKWTLEELFPIWRAMWSERQRERDGFRAWLEHIGVCTSLQDLKKYQGALLSTGCEKYNYAFLVTRCRERARLHLADFLSALCTTIDSATYPEGYFAGLFEALCAAMDRHSAVAEKQVADTAVKRRVFQRLEFAEDKKCPVSILGDARLGKSVSGAARCNARPGARRLVTIPETNDEWDFLAAHADSLGIHYTPQTSVRELRRAVAFVIEQTSFFLVYDEFHYALPVRYKRNAVPHRLNWIRSHVVDRGLGCAFLATRQTYHAAMDRFVKETQYQMEQWIGRVADPLVLSATLEEPDLLNIARSQFAGVRTPVLKLVVGLCMAREEADAEQAGGNHSGATLRRLHQAISYAQWLAEKAGSNEITKAHVESAWAELMGETLPQAEAPEAANVKRGNKPPAKPPRALGAGAAEAPANVRRLEPVREILDDEPAALVG